MPEKLGDKIVKTLVAPASGNRITYDRDIKGFGVRITASGARSFVMNYRAAGRERRLTIGQYPAWSVNAARIEAQTLRRKIDLGQDPMRERHDERAAPTVADLSREYIERHAVKKRSRRDDETMIRNDIIPRLGKLKVQDVRHADFDRLHREITKRAPIRANRVIACLSKMFALAVKWDWRTDNPVRGIEKNPEEPRTRHLSSNEIARLADALSRCPESASANAIKLLMLTGARRGEVLTARWEQFDFVSGIWTKPSAHTKQKREHRIPLSAPALLLLDQIRKTATGDYVFPGRSGEPLTDIKRFWATICKAAKITDCRIHDLRHTYASLLASAGLSLPIIGALLGHTQAQTTQRYAHLFDDPLRQATERVGAVVAKSSGDHGGNVLPLKWR